MNTEEVVWDEIDEDDETCAAVDRDTMFDDVDPYPKELIFAPGEGKKPISLFTNKDIGYLAFPTIFCGERCKRGDVTVHYSEICKNELRSVDRRVAKMCQTCSSSWGRYKWNLLKIKWLLQWDGIIQKEKNMCLWCTRWWRTSKDCMVGWRI